MGLQGTGFCKAYLAFLGFGRAFHGCFGFKKISVGLLRVLARLLGYVGPYP